MAEVEAKHIFYGGSATMPDDDTTVNIGGAADFTKKVAHARLQTASKVKAVSENAADNDTIAVHFQIGAGDIGSENIVLNGQTPVESVATLARLLKAIKQTSTDGNVALFSSTALHSGTAQGGGDDYIDLDAGASATPGAYPYGTIVRITSGTGQYSLNECVWYEGGDNRRMHVRDWSGDNPASDSGFEICEGMFFNKLAMSSEVMEVRCVNYLADIPPSQGGSLEKRYEKFFIGNGHASQTLIRSKVSEVQSVGLYEKYHFALETTIDGTGTNGAGNNRLVAPSSGVGSFDSTEKDVVDGNLAAGSAIGVWMELSTAPGDSDFYDVSRMQLKGSSISA